MKIGTCIATATGVALFTAAPGLGSAVGIRVIVENRAPEGGTWLTPMWVAVHDGTFDTHQLRMPATMELERLAEDGNVGPLTEAFQLSGAGEISGAVVSQMGIPPLAPGESAALSLMLDSSLPTSRYFSFASMVIPSNDAFIANGDPVAHRIFDDQGSFLGAFIEVAGMAVKDAGTEVNDEVPANTAFFGQMTPDTGVPENGVVHLHPGFLPPGSGGILDDPMFENADFLAADYEMARIVIVRTDTVVPAGDVFGTWTVDGSPYLLAGDVTVPAGETLTVEPGVVVFAQSWYSLTVHGTLEAMGTEEQPVTFTATPPGPGEPGWKGIRFVDAEGGHLAWCVIENGQVMAADPFDRGGAIYGLNSSPLVEHCTLRDNRASDAGGAAYLEGGAPVIRDCTIEGNDSGQLGGAICSFDADATIDGNTIRGNEAAAFGGFGPAHAAGGGVYVNGGQVGFTGNVVADNEVHAEGNVGTTARGGGLRTAGGVAITIDRNTFSGNLATGQGTEGGGLHLGGGAATVVNTIVEGSVGGGVFLAAAADVSYSDFHANAGGDFAGPAVPPDLGVIVTENANGDPADAMLNIFLDPLLVAPGAGDYGLMPGSPCIDAGDPRSAADPDGTVADLGAVPFDQDILPPGDINGDGEVNVIDLAQVIIQWGPCPMPCPPSCDADVNGDCQVDVQDLVTVIQGWTG